MVEKNNINDDDKNKLLDLTNQKKVKSKKAKRIKNFDQKKEKKRLKLEILKKLSSGTGLREGINDIVSGGMGALILISNNHSSNIFQGGFKINSKFTSKRLTELAKMDGAIILSEDYKKILYANTLLTPNTNLSTIETGTRHQAAERAAKQIDGIIIAVSERKGQITLYYRNSRYVLQNTEELLRRATETLQILEKQREVFDELVSNLNMLEINNMVSVADVCTILERIEMIRKMAEIINEYIVELGRDGIIVRMRMREVTQGIEKVRDIIIKDYLPRPKRVVQFLENLNFEELLDLENMALTLFKKSLEVSVIPKGHRILGKTTLPKLDIEHLIKHYKNLDTILTSDEDDLKKILKKNLKVFEKEINLLREHIMVGKKI